MSPVLLSTQAYWPGVNVGGASLSVTVAFILQIMTPGGCYEITLHDTKGLSKAC